MILYAYPPHDSYFLETWGTDRYGESSWFRTEEADWVDGEPCNIRDEAHALELAARYAADGHKVRVIKVRTTCEAIETLEARSVPQ